MTARVRGVEAGTFPFAIRVRPVVRVELPGPRTKPACFRRRRHMALRAVPDSRCALRRLGRAEYLNPRPADNELLAYDMDVNTMPEPLKSHWEALDEETIWLHGRWKIYRQLFGTSPERVEVPNESAGAFFYIIENVLMKDVELTLGKLADPAKTAGRQNLTLESLVKDVRQLDDATLCKKIDGMLVDCRRLCEKVTHRRNKQLAHFDPATLMAAKSTPIPGPSRQEIEDALLALRAFMNALQRKFTNAETAYGGFVLTTDGDLLLSVLEQGLRYQELTTAGTVDWDDLRQHSKYFGI